MTRAKRKGLVERAMVAASRTRQWYLKWARNANDWPPADVAYDEYRNGWLTGYRAAKRDGRRDRKISTGHRRPR